MPRWDVSILDPSCNGCVGPWQIFPRAAGKPFRNGRHSQAAIAGVGQYADSQADRRWLELDARAFERDLDWRIVRDGVGERREREHGRKELDHLTRTTRP